MTFQFEKLLVYQKSVDFADDICSATTSLGFAYIVSILSSFVVSLTVTPVLSYYLLPTSKATHSEQDGPVLRALKWIVSPLIRISMRVPTLLLIATCVIVAIAGWQLAQLGRNFLPAFDEGSVQVNVTLPPGLFAAGVESSV